MNKQTEVISSLIKKFTVLESILIRERNALLEQKRPGIDLLNEFAQKKTFLFDAIAEYSMPSDQSSAQWTELKTLMQKCRQINDENALIVNQRLKSNFKAISIVKQFAGDQSVSLYDSGGGIVQSISNGRRYKV